MRWTKRVCGSLAMLLLIGVPALTPDRALAQAWPTKPIELVIPWPPGGRTDTMVRMLAPFLEKELGQPVVVVNKVGGGGLPGMTFLRSAPPDGYVISSGGHALASMQYQRKTDLSLWDFQWLARIYSQPIFLAVPANSRFKSVKELVEFARANPGKLRHGNTGPGSSTHIASASMGNKLGITITQVPYKGEGPAIIGLAGAETDLAFGLLVALRPFIESQKIRILGVAGDARDPSAPNVPTFKEEGVDFVDTAFEAILVPKGVPVAVADRLTNATRAALANPELKAKFATVGLDPAFQDSAAFTQWLRGYDSQMLAIIKALGLYARD